MPRKNNTIHVRCSTAPLLYEVESWGRPDSPHTVDLTQLDGNGTCDCSDFQTRCYPNLKENNFVQVEYGSQKHKNKNRTHCKHIMAARRFFIDRTIRHMIKELNKESE